LAINAIIEKEDEERDTREDDNEDDEEGQEKKWDCESILSTYTNTDNHPAIIKTAARVVRANKQKFELHKQFKVPLDGLVAEEFSTLVQHKSKKDKKKEAAAGPIIEADSEAS
jgi:hypothetical protein